MASRSVSVPKTRVAGLERAARCAGESFAYEETPAQADLSQMHRLWWLAAVVALVGLMVLAAR
ncbi:hypothetical protein ABE438_13655 [Bosea sp. TWI1241]|jgi:hypothetical protein|uniref:hypothetical protein n=1 Tax=Bosea sp. TWI1241 TaxID=3148904 RepID=UPI0032087F49